jgi:hypothetical protein
MLQVARLAPKLLGESTALVADFFKSQWHADGGYCNRDGQSDLYYSVFGLEGAIALQQPLPTALLYEYVKSFGEAQDLDLIHVACLARCWAALPANFQQECPVERLLQRIEAGRTKDGGYESVIGRERGSLYGAFMAVGAYQDLRQPIPDQERLLDFVAGLRNDDGAFQQSLDLPVSLVPATAGAVTLLRHLGDRPIDGAIGDWLLSCFDPQGGFRSAPSAPIPDLLSTATALHALTSLKIDIGPRKEPCLDFIDSLWTNRGGFFGHWEDSHVDCEYTYYGLLALGHLSL